MLAETLNQRVTRLAPHFTLVRPAHAGQIPVVIMLHGCGGPRPFIDEMGKVVANAGAAALIVDSFAPRGISRTAAFATVCTGLRLRGGERAGDLFAAMAWARAQAWVAPGRIAAAGWSHGGWTILDALALQSGEEMRRITGISDLPREPLEGMKGALIVYPYTGLGALVGRRSWRIAPRTIAIAAGRDYIVGAVRPALERQRQRGAPIEMHYFEHATHAFEDAEAEDPRVRYDADATARERDLLGDLIAKL